MAKSAVELVRFRTAFGEPVRTGDLDVFEATMTQQSLQDETDMNLIIERAMRGQVVTHVNEVQAMYADVAEYPVDYQSALNLVMQAQETFDLLPAKVRDRFGNDPGQFMSFMDRLESAGEGSAELDEAVDLGLATRRQDAIAEAAAREAAAVESELAASVPNAGRDAGKGSGAQAPSKGATPQG